MEQEWLRPARGEVVDEWPHWESSPDEHTAAWLSDDDDDLSAQAAAAAAGAAVGSDSVGSPTSEVSSGSLGGEYLPGHAPGVGSDSVDSRRVKIDSLGGDYLPVRAPDLRDPKRSRLEATALSSSGRSASLDSPLEAPEVKQRSELVALEFDEAWQLLTDSSVTCDGNRPDFLLAGGQLVDACRGKIFKEVNNQAGGARRRRGTDTWTRKQGKKGHTDHHIQGTAYVVRRSYGSLKMKDEHGAEIGKTAFHYYEVRSLGAARDFNPEHMKYRLYHLPRLASNAPRETVHSGLQRFKLDAEPGSCQWLQFEDADERVMGTVEQNHLGFASFNTPAGDFAEWHRRLDGEPPFDEGDVVGLVPVKLALVGNSRDTGQQLTRRTKGASALGIITRRAAVAGSAPSPEERHLFDTVAYSGRVPVKVRGHVEAGRMVGPSGCEDGTAVMVSRWCVGSAVGRAEESTATTENKSAGSGLEIELLEQTTKTHSEWRSVNCLIVDPSQTLSGTGMLRRQFLVLSVLLICVLSAYVYFTRKPAPIVYCPAAEIDMLTWHGSTLTCHGCDTSRSTRLYVPRTAASVQPMRIECPGSSYVGSVDRICTANGWGPWRGSCRRKICPNTTFSLRKLRALSRVASCAGLSHLSWMPDETGDRIRPDIDHAIISINEEVEGTTRLIPCNTPYVSRLGYNFSTGYTGELWAHCPAGGEQWEINNTCIETKCPAATIVWPAGPDPNVMPALEVNFPETSAMARGRRFSCCQGIISMTGSCKDDSVGDGKRRMWLSNHGRARCSMDGTWHKESSFSSAKLAGCDIAMQCCPSTLVQFRADSDVLGEAAVAWQKLRSLPQTDWLPQFGALTAVSLSVAGASWRNIIASRSVDTGHNGHDDPYVLDSSLQADAFSGTNQHLLNEETSRGRSAAAFARVACRQLGFMSAPLVTTCGALQKTAQAAANAGDGSDKGSSGAQVLAEVASALCPPPVSTSSRSPKVDLCEVAPSGFDIVSTTQDYPDYYKSGRQWLQHVIDRQNNISHPMSTFQDEVQTYCSCDGSESTVIACFAACMSGASDWTTPRSQPCSHTLLVGCSNGSSAVAPRVAHQSHGGTWLVGDRAADAFTARPRRVFDATAGPYNCSSRELMGAGSGLGLSPGVDRIAWNRELCWGTLLAQH